MSTPQTPKPVFTRLTPEMSRAEKLRNLKAALEKSGFNIVEDNSVSGPNYQEPINN